jgi:hypothetical protein
MGSDGSTQRPRAGVVLAPLVDDKARSGAPPLFEMRLPRPARSRWAPELDRRPSTQTGPGWPEEAVSDQPLTDEPDARGAEGPGETGLDGRPGDPEDCSFQRELADVRPENGEGLGAGRVGGGRLLSASLFIPAETSRRDRSRQRRQARQLEVAAEQARVRADRQDRRAANQAARSVRIVPAGGEHRRSALRSYRRLKVQPHRATSDLLGGVYPFLAEAGLGSDGVYIGTDSYCGSAFVFDPFVLYQRGIITNPNMLVAGVLGAGKSAFAKSFTTRSIPFARRVYVPGDPKGEWSVVARSVGGQAIELGRGLRTRLNPLDEGIRPNVWVAADGTREVMTDDLWAAVVRGRRQDLLKAVTQSALGRDLASVEVTAVFAALDAAAAATHVPTLPHVVAAVHDPPSAVEGSTQDQLRQDGRQAGHALNRLVCGDLAGLFDGPSTTRFDPTLPMVSMDLSRISGSDQLIAMVMTCASSWMEAALQDPESPLRFIVYDEAWRTLREPSLLARMQSQWKLARALGICNMMIIHALTDLDAVGEANSQSRNLALGLLRDCGTKVVYAQEADQIDRTCTGLGLSSAEASELLKLDQGEALWRVGQERSFVVRHRMTTGTGSEMELFDTNTRMRDVDDR